MTSMHARSWRAPLPQRRITRRRVTTMVLRALGCAATVACRGVEPTATPADVRSHAAVADIGTTARPDDGQPTLLAYVGGRSQSHDLYVLDISNGRSHRLTRDRASTFNPTWSPDGSTLAFSSNIDGGPVNIYTVSAVGGSPTRVSHDPTLATHPDWSPVGGKIAFMSLRDGNAEIYVMNTDGTNEVNLSQHASHDADGSGVTQLTFGSGQEYGGSWSPDGARIVFPSYRNGQYDLYTINVDGSGEAQLTNTPESEGYPKWSASGIAFTVWTNGDDRQVYRMDADGTGVRQLTRGTPSFQAAWKP